MWWPFRPLLSSYLSLAGFAEPRGLGSLLPSLSPISLSQLGFSLPLSLLAGAQIIDLMMLVIDVTKGLQTQSAECLVIGQIACQKLVVVLNKIDLLAEGKRQAAIDRMTKKMQKTLENTK